MSRRHRSPRAEARGLGSAKRGTAHFKAQRLTAIALVPLGLWLVASLVALAGADYETAAAWVGSPLVTVLLVGLMVALVHHAQLGLQVVIEDYVHGRLALLASLVVLRLGAFGLAIAAIVAIIRIAVTGG